jgi:choline dehydrogenase-like flavoprotein
MEKKRAVGVEYRQGGQLKQLRAAREVLLSAGALLSPQLLMLSGIGPGASLQEHGIAVVHDLPGVGSTCTTTPTWCRWCTTRRRLKDLFGVSPHRRRAHCARHFDWRRTAPAC